MKRFAGATLIFLAILLFSFPALAAEKDESQQKYEVAWGMAMGLVVKIEKRNAYLVGALDGADKLIPSSDAAAEMVKVQNQLKKLGVVTAEKKAELAKCVTLTNESVERAMSILKDIERVYIVQEALRMMVLQILEDEEKKIEEEIKNELLV